MGSKVLDLAGRDPRFVVSAGIARGKGRYAPPKAFRTLAKDADVVIDFTGPAASAAFARDAAALRKPIVIGSTGMSSAQLRAIKRASAKTAVFLAPNMSPAMNVMFHLARRASELLSKYDAAIVETHHRMKKDAPSGTALKLAESLGRRSSTSSVRAGGVVGDHTLLLCGPHERLEITHRVQSREVFAQGALAAAAWLRGRRPGLYDFSDLMRLRQ